MLVKWFISSFQSNTNSLLNELQLNLLAQQCCNNLLSVGVIQQISNVTTTNTGITCPETENNIDKFDSETFSVSTTFYISKSIKKFKVFFVLYCRHGFEIFSKIILYYFVSNYIFGCFKLFTAK